MPVYTLGTLEASEALLRDLYIDLRAKVNAWSQITCQTPQARMGYVGQHLVSVVTGFPGGKSGARGHDLEMGEGAYGEIKTCYRVDQLGACRDCGGVVSSLETQCARCASRNIDRKDDSKWLITLRNDGEFAQVLEPLRYYFVLFEFADLTDPANNDILASIWQVNPRNKGFAYCMADYYLNIRAKSASKAPFNMWPHELKFLLTRPELIYRSLIRGDGRIETLVFPTLGNGYAESLRPLETYARATTLTPQAVRLALARLTGRDPGALSKRAGLARLEEERQGRLLDNGLLCDLLAEAVYLPLLEPVKAYIPPQIRMGYPELQ